MADGRRGGTPPVLAMIGMVALATPIVLLGRGADVAAPPGSATRAVPGTRPGSRPGPALDPARKGPGDLALPGQVVDTSGMPVRGATITAELELGPGDTSRAPVATAAAPLPVVVAVTAVDGRFTLDGIVAGRHRLEVAGDDIFTAEVRFVPAPSDDLRIVVARRVAISGRVVDGRGPAPAPGAIVEIAGDSVAGRRAVIADDAGGFSFDAVPEGNYQVWAWHGDLAARAQRVARLGSGPFAPVLLVLEPASVIVGRVVDRDAGTGVAAAVELRPLDSPDEAPRYARSDGDGRFRVDGVPRGRWSADAWSPGWVTVSTVELEAGRGAPEIELVRGGVIEGRVVDDRGRGLAGASVRAIGPGAAGGAAIMASARDDDERLRRYSGLGPAALAPPGGLAPAAADPRFVPRGELGVLLGPIPYPPPPGARVGRPAIIIADDALDAAASLDPRLADPSAPLPADPARAASWVSDADGRFRITGLPRGEVTVFAVAAGFAEATTAPLPTAPGRVTGDVVLVLSIGGVVTGTVTNQHGAPVIGATVGVAPRGNTDASRRIETVTGSDGEFRVGPITGDVTVTATAYGHGDASIEIALPRPPAGAAEPVVERRDLVLVVADAVLTGTVEDQGGLPVRSATVSIVVGAGVGRSAVTDDAGFKIAMLPPGAVTLRVDHPDYPLREFAANTADIAHLQLPWGGGVEGLVLDHHTGAPVGAVVVARGPGTATNETAVGPDGTFDLVPLEPGAWRLAITQPGYLPVSRTVDVAAGTRAGAITVRDVRLELERGATLAGTVRDRFGSRVPNVTVTLQRATGDGPIATARSDAEGEFRLRDAPTGAVVLRGTKDGGHGALRGELELTTAPGDERAGLELAVQ